MAEPFEGDRLVGPMLLTVLFLPAGLILSLVMANRARQAGRSQQPIWTGFLIGAVLVMALVVASAAMVH